MKAKTVREHLKEDIEFHFDQIDEIKTVWMNLKRVAPKVLDMECKLVATVSDDHISLYAHKGSSLMVDIFNLTDKERMEVHQTKYNSRYAFFKFGDFRVQVSRYSPPRPCKSYRVTKIVEVCGEIDESRYESVEEVDV